MSKFLGFLLGVAVALAGPAVFGVLAAPGGIELNAKGMALAYGIGALIFWAVVSYFSGAGALGAFVAFGTLVYCWLWIPNRTTNFLNDVPGVTNGMIDGSKQYTLNGVVPILTVVSVVYAIQLIVQSVQRRRRARAEAERLQREQEAAQAQQEADAADLYPVAGSTYPASGQYGGSFGNSTRYDDLFDEEEPASVPPRSQADEQTAYFPTAGPEQTAQFPVAGNDAEGNDETVLVPGDRDETVQVPTAEAAPPEADDDQTVVAPVPTAEADRPEPESPQQGKPDGGTASSIAATTAPAAESAQPIPAEPKPAEPTASKPEPTQPIETAPKPAETVAAEPEPTQPTAVQPEPAQPTAVEPAAMEAGTAEVAEQTAPPAEVMQQVAPEPHPAQQAATEPEPTQPIEVEGGQVKSSLRASEQMGQQYRERMEDPEDTGEREEVTWYAGTAR